MSLLNSSKKMHEMTREELEQYATSLLKHSKQLERELGNVKNSTLVFLGENTSQTDYHIKFTPAPGKEYIISVPQDLDSGEYWLNLVFMSHYE